MPRRALGAPLALLLATTGCRDWREHVEPSRAAAEPEQVLLAEESSIEFEAKHHQVRLTPRAAYRITGYAADTSRKLIDAWDFVMPLDVALVWSRIAEPAVLRHLKFHLAERYVSYWYDASTPPAAVGQLPSHIANNHLIPASDDVAAALARVRAGDLVTLRGKLVDVVIHDRRGREVFRARTSLRRDDVGSGACEIVWVEAAEVERPE